MQFLVLHIVALAFIIFNLFEYNFLFERSVTPFFILMIVFFWSIYQPSLFHPVYIFFIGFVYDVFFNFYIGLHSLLFVFLYFTLSRQRVFLLGQNYFVIYLLFILIVAATHAFEIIFYYIILGSVQDYLLILYNFSATILLFPLFNFLHVFLRTSLVEYEGKK